MTHNADNVKSIFMTAIENYSPDQWPGFLDDACGDDAALRGRVEELLQAHVDMGSIHTADPAPTIDQPITEKPGVQIGPYKLLEQIGEGGMGVVYMAEQTEPVQRRVALKIIKPGMDTRQVIARFEAERQALAMMDHPNIAKVLDAGTTGESSRHTPCAEAVDGTRSVPTTFGRPYFVMELVKGIPITTYCDQRRLTPRERLELFIPVCQAVQHAHQKGIIHRDLKPSNVLVALYDDQPVPKVIDFGVAKATSRRLTEKTMFTHYGQVVGTLEYMSPEQANLNQLDIDTRSDIYSLGVLLYELLTGDTPLDRGRLHSAAFDEMMRMIREEDPPRPSLRLSTSASLPLIAANRHTEPKKLRALVHGELDWIVMKALEKDRSRRYETATGLANDIGRYLNNEAVNACPPSATYRLKKLFRRNRRLIVSAALVAATLVLATIISIWAAVQAGREAVRANRAEEVAEQRLASEQQAHAEADRARKDADRQRADAIRARDRERVLRQEADWQRQRAEGREVEARWHLYLARLHLLPEVWHADEYGQLDLMLSTVVPGNEEPDFRHWEWYYLRDQVDQRFRTVPGRIRAAAWSPDGKSLACAGDGIRLFHASSLTPIRSIGTGIQYYSVGWSPDGTRLAAGQNDGLIHVWQAASGTLQCTLTGHQCQIRALDFSPDGRQLVSGSGSPEGSVIIWDPETASDVRTLFAPADSQYLGSVDWHPEQPWIASSHRDGYVRVWDARTGELRWDRQACGIACWCAAWSPDGAYLLGGGGVPSHDIHVWDPDGQLISKHPRQGVSLRVACWSPDGSRVAIGRRDHEIVIHASETGDALQTTHIHTGEVTDLEWSVNGQVVSVSASETRVWGPDTPAQASIQLSRPPDSQDESAPRWPGGVAWSPDGRWLAAACADGNVRLWDATTDQLRWTWQRADAWPTPESTPRGIAWSPDGSELAAIDNLGTVVIWNAEDHEERLRFVAGEAEFNPSLTWSPDGRWIATGNGFTTQTAIWDAENGIRVMQISLPVRDLAFSPNGQLLAAATSGHIQFVDLSMWEAMPSRFVVNGITEVSWNPQSTLIAVASDTGSLTVFDADTRKVIAQVQGHTDSVRSVTWSCDGRRIATGGGNGEIVVWDATTLERLLSLRTGNQWVTWLQWSPDDRRLASAGPDGIFVWGSPEIGRHPEDVQVFEHGIVAAYQARSRALAAGESAVRNGQYHVAVRELTTGIERMPEDVDLRIARGEAYAEIERWPEAAEDFTRATEIDDSSLTSHVRLVICKLMAGDDVGTAEQCRVLLDLAKQSLHARDVAEAAWAVALAARMPSDIQSALTDLVQQAIQAHTDARLPGLLLAAAALRCGDHETVIARLKDDRSPDVLSVCSPYLLAIACAGVGDGDRASEYLAQGDARRAVALADHLRGVNVLDWQSRAALWLLRREARQRIRDGDDVQDPWDHLLLAAAHSPGGDLRLVEQELRAAIAADPSDPSVWEVRAALLQGMGEPDRAERDWQRAVDLAGEDPLPWIRRSRFFAGQGRHDLADSDLDRAAALTPNQLNRFLEAGWWAGGPFPADLNDACLPETDLDPSRPVHAIDWDSSLSDRPTQWQAISSGPAGQLRLDTVPRFQDADSVYVMTYIDSPDQRAERIDISTEVPCRFWLNGRHVGDVQAGASNVPQYLAIALRPGRNTLLARVRRGVAMADVRIQLGDGPKPRVYRYACYGQVPEAAGLLADEAFAAMAHQLIEWSYFAPLLPACGDHAEYVRQLDQAFRRVAVGAFERYRLAAVCVLADNPVFQQRSRESVGFLRHYIDANSRPQNWHLHEARVALALSHYRLGEFDEALRRLAENEQGPLEYLSHPVQALIHHRLGSRQDAEAALARAVATAANLPLDPKNVSRPITFAVLLREAEATVGETREASDGLLARWRSEGAERLAAQDPRTAAFDDVIYFSSGTAPQPFLARARRWAELGDWQQAQRDLHQAVELAPEDPNVLAARAAVYAEHGDVDRSAEDLTTIYQLIRSQGPSNCPIDAVLARHAEVLDKLIERIAQESTFAYAQGVYRAHGGAWEDAARSFQQARQRGLHGDAELSIELMRGNFEQTCETYSPGTMRHAPLEDYDAAVYLCAWPWPDVDAEELVELARQAWREAPDSLWRERVVGLAYYRAMQDRKAIEVVERSMTRSAWRHQAWAWPLLAMAYHRLDDHQQARRFLAKTEAWLAVRRRLGSIPLAIGEGPESVISWALLQALAREAETLIRRPESWAAEAQRLAERQAHDPIVWAHRAHSYARADQQGAIAAAARAIELDLDNPRRYLTRANLYFLQQRPDEALADLGTALDLAKDDADIWTACGDLYETMDRWDLTIAAYRKAIQLAPERYAFWRARAESYGQSERWDRVVAVCSALLEHHPNSVDFRHARAVAYGKQDLWNEAIEDYRQVVKINPTLSLSWARLLEVEAANGASFERRQAIAAEAEAVLSEAARIEFTFQHAAFSLLVNDRAAYDQICRDIVARYADATDPRTLCLATRAAALGNPAGFETGQLVEMARRSVEESPLPWHRNALGLCLLRDGQIDAAIEQLNVTVDSTWPGAPISWLGLSLAYFAGDRPGQARGWLNKTRKWCQQNPLDLDLDAHLHPHDRITCQLLLREAEQLAQASDPKPSDGEQSEEANPETPPQTR